jgi:hypothetical protein
MINEFGERLRTVCKMAGLNMEGLAQATWIMIFLVDDANTERPVDNPLFGEIPKQIATG